MTVAVSQSPPCPSEGSNPGTAALQRSASAAARILVVEDDAATASEIAACLSSSGYTPEWSADGLAALSLALGHNYDAITLDRMLPGLDGLQLMRSLREAGSDTPILMVSALGDVDDRVLGLRAGGDDYMIKPFAPDELVARLEVLLRRHRRAPSADTTLRVGELQLDLVKHEARRRGRTIELLPMEFRLLEYMMRNCGQLLTRRMIFESVWGYYFDPGTNLINVHVGKLRRKVDGPGEPPMFATERGVGYRIDAA